MEVGYLPDMFGHVAQMPQLLAAVRLRRTPSCGAACRPRSTAPRSGGRAPTARRVRAEYLPDGLRQRRRAARRRQGPARAGRAAGATSTRALPRDDEPLLWMNGTDHLLAAALARPRRRRGERACRTTTRLRTSRRSPSYLAGAHRRACRRGEGELRSGARANLLMGVASNRVDVRQRRGARRARARTARRAAERAVRCPPTGGRRPLLDEAWLRGDPQRRARLELRLLDRRGVRRRARTGTPRRARSPKVSPSGHCDRSPVRLRAAPPSSVNVSARPRRGAFAVTVPGDDIPAHAQLVERLPADELLVAGGV